MIITVASPSASGKTTLVTQAIEKFSLTRLKTATTRKRRPEEVGDEYYFIPDRETFMDCVSLGHFIEHNEVYGNLYGLYTAEVSRNIDKKAIIIMDVGGVRTMRQLYGNSVKSIFIMPPSVDELKQRLIDRNTGDPEDMKRRLAEIDREVAEAASFDYVVESSDLESTIARFNAIIEKIICPVHHA